MAKVKGYLVFGSYDGFDNDSYLLTNILFSTVNEAQNYASKHGYETREFFKDIYSAEEFAEYVKNDPNWNDEEIQDFIDDTTPREWRNGVEIGITVHDLRVISDKEFQNGGCQDGACIVAIY